MSTDKHRADQLADALGALEATGWGGDCFALTDHSEEQARLAAAELRRIPALEAERDQLRIEVGRLQECVRLLTERSDRENAKRDQLRAEVEALRADAERYRHLTTSMGPHTTLCYDGKESIGKTEFDAVIDAARKQQ